MWLSWQVFFLALKFLTNVKNVYDKRIFEHFFFEKKIIRFEKIESHVAHFPIDFGLISIF